MFLFINNHFSFYGSYFGMNYSNVIGFFSLLIFFIQFFTGLLSSNYYINYHLSRPDPIIYINNNINNGWFIRLLHILGATLFMLFIYFHLIRGFWLIIKLFNYNINLIRIAGWLIIISPLIEGFLVIF